MIKSFTQLREEREDGFTLIELLVVILIIGILAGIAIPSFLNQRKGAVDAAVEQDIKNVGTTLSLAAMEGSRINSVTSIDDKGNITDESAMASSFMMRTSSNPELADIKLSSGTTVVIQPSSVNGAVCIFAVNPGGNQAAKAPGFVYDSNAGGILREGLSPSACADEAGELNVPTPAIERALDDENSGGPVAGGGDGQPSEDEETEGPSPSLYQAGMLWDEKNSCYVPGSNYEISAAVSGESLSWNLSGLDQYTFAGEGVIAFGDEYEWASTGGSIEGPMTKMWGNVDGFSNKSIPFFRSTESYAPIAELDGDYVFFGNPDGSRDFANECGGADGAVQELASYSGSLYDKDRQCFITGSDYTFKATVENNIVSWKISGLDKFGFQDGTIKIGSQFGNIDFDNNGQIKNFTYSGNEAFAPNNTYSYFDAFGADPMYFGGDESKGSC